MELSYRPMTPEDLPAVFSIRLATVENVVTLASLKEDYGITPESLTAAMQFNVQSWLCEASGRPVGFAMGNRSNGEVIVVAVIPGYEGNGIGQTVLALVQDWLFAEGHEKIWLFANPESQYTCL